MKKYNKPFMIAAAAAAIGYSGIAMSAATHAAGTTTSTDPMSSLVQAIASKFNLNPTDVQAVVTAQKTQMEAQHQADFKAKLDAAVTKGTITQAQEDLIIAKQAEEQTFRTSLQGMSETDRQTAMQAHRTALNAWATANKIPQQFMPGGFGGRGGHGGHGHGPGSMNGMPPTAQQ